MASNKPSPAEIVASSLWEPKEGDLVWWTRGGDGHWYSGIVSTTSGTRLPTNHVRVHFRAADRRLDRWVGGDFVFVPRVFLAPRRTRANQHTTHPPFHSRFHSPGAKEATSR